MLPVMQSPGLTAAPAVGELIANEIARVSGAAKKADFQGALPKHKAFNYMNLLMKRLPRFPKTICTAA